MAVGIEKVPAIRNDVCQPFHYIDLVVGRTGTGSFTPAHIDTTNSNLLVCSKI